MPTFCSSYTSFLFHFIGRQKFYFVLLVIFSLPWAIDQTILTYFFKDLLDNIINFTGSKKDIWNVIWLPTSLCILIWITTSIMFRLFDYVASIAIPKIEKDIRLFMIQYTIGHSYEFFANNFAGSVSHKISDMVSSTTGIIYILCNLFIPTFFALLIAVGLFLTMQPIFAILLLLWFCIHFGIAFAYARECNNLSVTRSQARSNLSGRIVDVLTNIYSVKTFSKASSEMENIKKAQDDEVSKHVKLLRKLLHVRCYMSLVHVPIVGVMLFWLLIDFWQKDIVSSAELVYIFYTSWGLSIMAWVCGTEMPNLFSMIGVANQAMYMLQINHEISDKKHATKLIVEKGKIEFRNVNFGYNENNHVFRNKNLTILPGEKIGLVGKSGSGKSSFVNLILRFYDIQSGSILIDDQNIANVTQDSLRSNIGIIPQDTTLFHNSLAENIRYAKPSATMEEIVFATKKACLHDFVESLPEGYDTYVGERGVKLSGGQRQRIAIARAFLKNAPILIFDEATSALDSLTEKYIQNEIESIISNSTTIVIAHRLSTLIHMDKVLLFDQGTIMESGSHEELLKQNRQYAQMWNMQSDGFIDQ